MVIDDDSNDEFELTMSSPGSLTLFPDKLNDNMEDIQINSSRSSALVQAPDLYINKKSKRPWQDYYLTEFPWLRYNKDNQTAYCSFRCCDMYYIYTYFT